MENKKDSLNFLVQGLSEKITAYNSKHYTNHYFSKKNGHLDISNATFITIPEANNQTAIVFPLLSPNRADKKFLVAYYHNGERNYWFFKDKSYPLNGSAPFFINYLDVFFNTAYPQQSAKNTKLTNKRCYVVSSEIVADCAISFFDSCGRVWVMSEKGCGQDGDEADLEILDEVVINGTNNNDDNDDDYNYEPKTDYSTPFESPDTDEEIDFDPVWDFDGGSGTIVDDKIDDSQLTGKEKCAYEILKNTNGNLFNKTIGLFGIPGAKYNLIFEYGKCDAGGSVMCTDPKDLKNNNLTIIIAQTENTVLETVASILHEGIHAEIFRYVKENGGNADPNNRINLYNWYHFYKVKEGVYDRATSNAQHQHMADMYIYPIARALREVDGYKYTVDYYLPFAWEGLEDYGKDRYYDPYKKKNIFFNNSDYKNKRAKVLETTTVGKNCN
ncbi:MAG: hypothetical protein ACK5MZ_08400 [Aestuariibaculum sp.]